MNAWMYECLTLKASEGCPEEICAMKILISNLWMFKKGDSVGMNLTTIECLCISDGPVINRKKTYFITCDYIHEWIWVCVSVTVCVLVSTVLMGVQADARFHWLDTFMPLPSNIHLQRCRDKTVSAETDTKQLSSSSPCYHAAAILNRWCPNNLSCLRLLP